MIIAILLIAVLVLLWMWWWERTEADEWREACYQAHRLIMKLRNDQQGRDARGRFMRKQP